jgi:DNA-binding response OmpR family regulator
MATILVVDDEPDIRYLVQVNLELDGHRVLTAADGAEALAAIRTDPPDVVLLDVLMPGVDGWTVLEEIKRNIDDSIKTIPVLMLSALGGDDDRARGRIEGAIRYLVKPISTDDLRAAIRDALEGDPEPEQRRRAIQEALEELARIERGSAGASFAGHVRPRLTRLEHEPPATTRERAAPDLSGQLQRLTPRQLELLHALHDAPTVITAASRLGMSRSNVYASLRRISRKLDVNSTQELLRMLRAGAVLGPPDGQ